MFGDHQSIRGKNRTTTHASEKIERAGVFVLSLVRRIKIDDIHRLRQFAKPLQHRSHTAILQCESATNLQRGKILSQRSKRRLSVLRKPDVLRATAYRLNPHRASTSVEIDKPATLQPRRKDVEERLPQAVTGRTSFETTRSGELTRSVSTCNDAHLSMVSRQQANPVTAAHTIGDMRGWSFPIGRFLGVDVRIHTFFLLILGLSISYASMTGATGSRGFALWLLLLLAVVVREVARAIGAAWFELDVRSVLLLPVGGLMSYASTEATEKASTPEMQKRMAVIGPTANIGFGLLLAALTLVIAPEVSILERPWMSPLHLLRAAVWMNILLGVVNLLPASPLDGGRVFRGEFAKTKGVMKSSRAAAGLGQFIAIALIVAGLLVPNMWLVMIGAFLMIGAHMEDQGLLLQTDVDAVRMRDVMLTQFSMLSASDTLEDALQRSVHTLQDVFPVVRGSNLVGAVSRQSIVDALQSDGNGYVQGVMTRSFQTAQPDDSLVKTLRRIMAGQGAQMVPVLEGDRIVGIITPQNLALSMGMLNQRRKLRQPE